jgi:hypothetical protein
VQEQQAIDNTEAMAQAWDDNQAQLQLQLGESEETQSERPEWLPEKFASPEDMAKAYSELEGKLSGSTEETQSEPVEPSDSFNAITAASDEFTESGQLSDETFKSLEDAGLPRDLVEAYIQGQQALAASQANSVYDAVGGEESYKAMAEWATENLDQSAQDAFNQIVESGSIEQAKVAAQGLFAQYRSATGGVEPKLAQGSTTGNTVTPFYSSKSLTDAMADPRYKHDSGYQAEVHRRLAVSDIL